MTSEHHPSSAGPATDPARLRAPFVRHDIVAHERWLSLRPAPEEAPVVEVVAPAGYGKTTVLGEWAAHSTDPALWVSLDRHMDDPVILASHIAEAILAVRPEPSLEAAVRAPAASVWLQLMPRISVALQRLSPYVLFVDDLHVIAQPETRDVLDWLMLHVPRRAQMALAGRSDGSSVGGRLRLEGRLAAVGPRDLALTDAEARELLRPFASASSEAEAAELNLACEGWVSGLLLSARGAGTGVPPLAPASASDLVGEYIRAEILAQLDDDARQFMLRASVLERATGQNCDTVLERSGSQQLLERLSATNVFVTRLQDGSFRVHELVRAALLEQLERDDPDDVAMLYRRAATWYAEAHEPETAVAYAIRSGHHRDAARLIGTFAVHEFGLGRQTMLDGWLEWAETHDLVGEDAVLSMGGSLAMAFTGRPHESERWAVALHERTRGGATLAQEPEAAGCYALLEAWQCRQGAEGMLRSAARAVELIDDRSLWRKSALTSLGFANLMNGASGEAARLFERVVEEGGPAIVDTAARSGCAAMLAREALSAHDIDRASHWTSIAARIRAESGTTEQGLQAMVDAVRARIAIAQGRDPRVAQQALAHAQRVRALTSWAVAPVALVTRLELARAYLQLADLTAARVVCREALDILHWRPGLGRLEDEVVVLRDQVVTQADSVDGPTALTAAELRLVPWLATHLAFREIGARLFLSGNTVKTEALSVYRKLGVSSRSAAVEAAVEAGLLDEAALPGVLHSHHVDSEIG